MEPRSPISDFRFSAEQAHSGIRLEDLLIVCLTGLVFTLTTAGVFYFLGTSR